MISQGCKPFRQAACLLCLINFFIITPTIAKDALEDYWYSYHGILIGDDEEVIEIDPEILVSTQEHYINQLVETASEKTRKAIREYRELVLNNAKISVSDKAYLRYALIAALLKKANKDSLLHLVPKNNLLKNQIELVFAGQTTFSNKPGLVVSNITTATLQGAINATAFEEVGPFIWEELIDLFPDEEPATEYFGQCEEAGVPTPPEWGSSEWDYMGELKKEFISRSRKAQVYVYDSASPPGSCIALPRTRNNGNVLLLGVICLGTETENACFWDNETVDGVRITNFNVDDDRTLLDFAGGSELSGGGGRCTDCHAGENPFVIHPEAEPFQFDSSVDITSEWYTPVDMPAAWPQNEGPTDILDNVDTSYNPLFSRPKAGRSCLGCHQFPELDGLFGYCNAVLKRAARRTMPPGESSAGWSGSRGEFRRHIEVLKDACR